MKYSKVVIVGMGLIGGSIGKALLDRKLADEVVGVFRRGSTLKRAEQENVMTSGYVNDLEAAVKGADIIILATPVNTIKKSFKDLSSILDKNTVVTDAGSTKKMIVDEAARYSATLNFVGSHPLAGSEKTGVENASSDLFEGSVCVLTPTDKTCDTVIKKVEAFWKGLGVEILIRTPEEHDKILAHTSHLPHVAAYALVAAQNAGDKAFMSTGLRSATRIASSDPNLWADILSDNKDNIIGCIDTYTNKLSMFSDLLKKDDQDGLVEFLKKIKEVKDEIG